jgi:hypothetical protein
MTGAYGGWPVMWTRKVNASLGPQAPCGVAVVRTFVERRRGEQGWKLGLELSLCEKLILVGPFHRGFSPCISWWTWTHVLHTFYFDLKRIRPKVSEKGGISSMAACRTWTRLWRHGDDGGRLGQRGPLGCMKQLGHTEPLLGPHVQEGKKPGWAGGGGGVSASVPLPGLKPFLFSNLQITLNSTQIWILNNSFSQNKIKSEHSTIQKKKYASACMQQP